MKNTVVTIQQMKEKGEKISMLTAYDYSTAKLEDEAGVNTILVGDSLGNVILGYEDTISVTMEDMIHHGAAVARGAKNALVVVDMPFMSYQTSVYDAVVNAGRLMKEGRAGAVKLEGGKEVRSSKHPALCALKFQPVLYTVDIQATHFRKIHPQRNHHYVKHLEPILKLNRSSPLQAIPHQSIHNLRLIHNL